MGFVAASSIERLPVEGAVGSMVQALKAVSLWGGTLCRPAARTVLFYLLGAAALAVSLCADSLNVLFPIPMGGPGYAALALLVFAILSWCLMLAPIAVTALAVLVLLPFTGLMDFGQVVATGFGDSTFAFFLGVLLLSAAFQKTPLGRRIALVIFRIFGCKPRCVLFGLMLAGMLLAMWVTEVASAAILYPLALSIVEQSRGRADHPTLARVLMLGVAWGPAFGGVATPIATGANLVAVNYLEQYAGITVSFGRWMSIGLPIAVTLLAAGWFLLAREIPRGAEALQIEGNIPPFSRKEAFLLADFLLAVLLWVLGEKVGLSASHHVALLAGLVLLVPGVDVLDWKEHGSVLSVGIPSSLSAAASYWGRCCTSTALPNGWPGCCLCRGFYSRACFSQARISCSLYRF